jgi:hypothetical protein
MRIVWNIKTIKMQYNSFEDSIRKQLLGAEMMPSPKVWENLEEELRTPPPPRRNPKWILGLFLLLT